MSTSPNPSRVPRSPSPSLPPPPTSAKLPPRPSASTTQHVPYSRQSLGPGLSSAGLPGSLANPPGSARNFSGPARAVGGGRPVSEILGGGLGVPGGGGGGGGGGADLRTPEAEAIDRWFQDLASYEVTLEEMAAASLDQNFTEELSAIEQWFRVLSEAERTAALYSLLQHSTQVQIRFFMTVLQQMARSDPMTALLSPAVGGGMQAQMEAKLANLNLRSPNRTSFGAVPASTTRESFGGYDHTSSYLTPESALANAGEGPASPAPRSASASNKASHRISAPGTLNSLSPSWAGAGQLDQVLERGPSPSAESVSSAKSNSTDVRPKSTDFTGLANGPPGSASFARSPRLGNGNGAGDEVTFPLSPSGAGGNWASMVNTPAVPMFATNHSTIQDHPAFSSLASSVPKLSEAPKRRSSAKMSMGGGNNLYNEDGELVGQKQSTGRGMQSPGGIGGGFQGPGAGAWSRSPALGTDHLGGGGAGFPNNFGLGVGGLGGGFAGLGSPSPSDIAFQMSQLQLQQLQLQQLQQLQQLGVANGGGIGMGLPMMTGLGMGMSGPGGLGFGQVPRSASLRSQGAYSPSAGGAGKRSPMMGMGGNINKSPSPGGRRESSGLGGANAEEDTDIRVLEDIPQWLRTLRLHKYTPNFEGAKWRDMVLMGDSDLEAKGVAALGARRKLLKTFELVRAQYGIAEPSGSTANGAGGENVAIASSASGDDEDVKR